MARRYWRAKHNYLDYCGVYHIAPPPQPEDLQKIAETGAKHAFRYLNTNEDPKSPRRPMGDFPSAGGGFLMSIRAAEVLMPLISPWSNIQSDVLVDNQPSHILAIVTQTYDAMNEATSIGKRGGRSGIWLEVEKLHLINSQIGPAPIFRAPTAGIQWDHILSEEIVDAIRVHELTGLTLQEAIVE